MDYGRREEITTPSVEDHVAYTPTLQVPTLRDGDVVLWESSLISEYLLSTYPDRYNSELTLTKTAWRSGTEWQDKLISSTIQTLGSAATTISQLHWSGIPYGDNDFLTRCADRLPHLLFWLEERMTSETGGFYSGAVNSGHFFHMSFSLY